MPFRNSPNYYTSNSSFYCIYVIFYFDKIFPYIPRYDRNKYNWRRCFVFLYTVMKHDGEYAMQQLVPVQQFHRNGRRPLLIHFYSSVVTINMLCLLFAQHTPARRDLDRNLRRKKKYNPLSKQREWFTIFTKQNEKKKNQMINLVLLILNNLAYQRIIINGVRCEQIASVYYWG